ncbi:MAG: PIN domain-containing protein [Gemmatimonadetes bacterium]|nr:PIN domain-containing protein [Gemmatimonadota bacterium]
MIYLDTSVALAHLLAEDRCPPTHLWDETLVASRLLEYELWNRLHARSLARTHADPARMLLARVAFLDLTQSVLARALEPFPSQVRTLDALHLASAAFLRERGESVALATYDDRMAEAAEAMGLELFEL